VRLEELADEPWISGHGPGSCYAMVNHACSEAGFQPQVCFETNDYITIQAYVAAGIGVALLAQLALTTVLPGLEVRRVRPNTPVRRIYAARLAEAYRPPAADAFLEILEAVTAEYQSRPPLALAS
jgi:DNA-binding transcriptional LysR family regulator